jgi:type II restriction enzyme
MRFTASDLLRAIAQLPKDREYNYINPANRGKIKIDLAVEPEGPIRIRRYDPSKRETPEDAEPTSISASAIRRVANAVRENVPLNIDRVLGASYNFRSVIETLLAHTPQFYYCYPVRIEVSESSQKIEEGHKHLIWLPNEPHQVGVPREREVNMTISEIPSVEAVYEALVLPGDVSGDGSEEYAALPPIRVKSWEKWTPLLSVWTANS